MALHQAIKPQFLHQAAAGSPFRGMLDYRQAWLATILIMALVTLTPLVVTGLADYTITERAVQGEARSRTARVVSNAKRSISNYLSESISALDLVVLENSADQLKDPDRLGGILEHLQVSFLGFADLGLVDQNGNQHPYVGDYPLDRRNYRGEAWFEQASRKGTFVSDVFLGYRGAPHFVAVVKTLDGGGGFLLLRAALDTGRFNDLARLELIGGGDSFIINRQGVLQTPSLLHGPVLGRVKLPIPPHSEHTEVFETTDAQGRSQVVAYAYIPDSPFILMVIQPTDELLRSWYTTRIQLLAFLAISVVLILVFILGVATYFYNRLHRADMKQIAMLEGVERINRMASIGSLAAGVAHEINNPLAVIGEKAGLIRDILKYRPETVGDERFQGLIDSIQRSVERGGTITRRLLSFTRHLDMRIDRFNLAGAIEETLGFVTKEAEYRSIHVQVQVTPDTLEIASDRGKLQQILLNLITNAFAAMNESGRLDIEARLVRPDLVRLTVADDGAGIPEENLEHIFEPFFSTKKETGGTGLGLTITSGLVKKLGGVIDVSSTVGVGTRVTVALPLVCRPVSDVEEEEGNTCGSF
jgi:signal transduction histidine kinase